MTTTDERVQKMNEVLTYIKFIKMYAWVKAFSQIVQSELKDFICAFIRRASVSWLLEHVSC